MLLGAAVFICSQSKHPMVAWQIGFIVFCVVGGAGLAIMPFLLEYRLVAKLIEIRELTGVISQLRNLDTLAGQISGATDRWYQVQEGADKTASAAKAIAERMNAELQGFKEFMQRADEGEKAAMRLELDKSRRAETDWLQVLVRMLDHVFALHTGAVRSGQPALIEQVGHFQNACRDAARRVGLTPFAAKEMEPFDAKRHQLVDGDAAQCAGAAIAETVAAGYTFQGKLLRPALVKLCQGTGSNAPAAGQPMLPPEPQSQLPPDPTARPKASPAGA